MCKRGISAQAPDIADDFLRNRPEVVKDFARGTEGVAKPLVGIMLTIVVGIFGYAFFVF